MEFSSATLGLGFLLGLRHALDADHLVAVSTIVSEQRRVWRSAWVGAFWGLGHTVSLAAVGGMVLLLRLSISPAVAFWAELGVALMLIVLGGRLVIREIRRGGWHIHAHSHGDRVHAHAHSHPDGLSRHEENHHRLSRMARLPVLVGMVHGLAGSAALMLLVLASIPSPGAAGLYILLFGAGSIIGMGLMSLLIGLPLALIQRRFSWWAGRLHLAAGAASVMFGLSLGLHLVMS